MPCITETVPGARTEPIISGCPQTGVRRLEDHPHYLKLGAALMDALKEFPDARKAVARALAAIGNLDDA
jgi:hypothetical protein